MINRLDDSRPLQIPKNTGNEFAADFKPPADLEPGVTVHQQSDTASALLLNRAFALRPPVDWSGAGSDGTSLLELFHLHYMGYLGALTDAQLEAVVRDWITHNRPNAKGARRLAWSSYVVSLRVVNWVREMSRRSLSEDLRLLMQYSIREQMRVLERNLERDVGGNHLIKNIRALLWAGRAFPRTGAPWRRVAESLLTREVERQVLKDGFHFELSPAYHTQVFCDLLECYQLASPALRNTLAEPLDRMAHAVADFAHPDGRVSLFSDGGLNMAVSPSVALSAYEMIRGQKPVAGRVIDYSVAGYFGVRDVDSLFLIDAGRLGADDLPAHGHADALSFEWSVGGRRVVVDTGVFEYQAGPLRSYVRGTSAHNTVTLERLDQAELWGSFRAGRRYECAVDAAEWTNEQFEVQASHSGYRHLAGAPRHTRRAVATSTSVTVRDTIDGGHGQRALARVLLHPDWVPSLTTGGCTLTSETQRILLSSDHAVSIEAADWYPDFGERVRTSAVVIDYGAVPTCGGFKLEVKSY